MAKASSLKTAASCLSHTERWDEEGNNNDSSCFCSPSFIFSPYILDITASFPPLPSREEKKRPTNLNPSLRQHQQSPRNIHTPFFSLFFPRCLLFLWIVLHGSHSAHARPRGRAPAHLSGSTPPPLPPPLPRTKSKGWYLMTDRFRTPVNPFFFVHLSTKFMRATINKFKNKKTANLGKLPTESETLASQG